MQKSKFKIIITFFIFGAVLLLPKISWAATYYISPSGTASWSQCTNINTPCSLSAANTNAGAGDTVYLRGGTYWLNSIYDAGIHPSHSGICPNPPCTGGVGANRITFAAYPGENPVLQQTNTTNKMMGIFLDGVSWIKITGITFSNFTYYLAWIRNEASYNEISYCQFTADSAYETGIGVVIGDFFGTSESVHNWIHHNYFSRKRNDDPCGEAIDMIKVGSNISNPWAADNNTTVENNYMEYVGHAMLVTNSLKNVIKNNIVHNEPWITGCSNWQSFTSLSSVTIGTGSKSFIIPAGLGTSWIDSNPFISMIYAGDYSQAMHGRITSYDNITGALVVNVDYTAGSGTYASWMLGQKNVPYYVNSSYNNMFSHRNFAIGDENHYVKNYNLIEGNRVGFSAVNPGNGGDGEIAFSSPGNIGRYNFVYGTIGHSGIFFKWPNAWGDYTGGILNHVYNNTVYHIDYGWNAFVYGAMNAAYNGEGISQNNYSKTINTNNVIKNNLVYDNSQGDICRIGLHSSNCAPESYDTVVNNWVTTNGDPKFVNPDMTNTLSQNLFPSVHGYTATLLPDLSLQASSGAIDGGTYLTQADGSGSNSTTLVVDDAMYFQDGTWGSVLASGLTMFPDWIAIGSVNNKVQISSVDYSTNTITLTSPMTWADNSNIWLYKNSSGKQVLYGSAPDDGAYEYASVVADTTPPSPPQNVSVS